MHARPPSPDPHRRQLLAGLALPLLGARPAHAQPETWPRVPLVYAQAANADFVEPLLDLLGHAARLRWERSRLPARRVLALAEQGRALGFGLGPTPQRLGQLAFSQPVFFGQLMLISRRERPLSPRSVDELKGLRVCVTRDASYGAELDAALGPVLQPEYTAGDLATRLRMLQGGRCDATLLTHRNDHLQQVEQRLLASGFTPETFHIAPQPLARDPVCIAVAPQSPLRPYLDRIDQALALKRDAIRQLIDR